VRQVACGVAGLLALIAVLAVGLALVLRPAAHDRPARAAVPAPFSHVFLIVMENKSAAALMRDPNAPYIRALAARYAYDSAYYGVTHPSLPNYVALIAGSTFGSHSDSPAQRFSGPTLAQQLDRARLSWQGVMQSLPYPGFEGAWAPGASEAPPTLYAEKHDPFMLFPRLRGYDRRHIVPLSTLARELRTGAVPRFVFIVPNLCDDMHGQPPGPGARCPAGATALLVRDGNAFLQSLVPRILHSPAWRGNAVLFVVWDEGGGSPTLFPERLRSYLAPGPAAPPLLAAVPMLGRFGGGNVPLIVVARNGPRHLKIALWADHYSILKTIEAAWHLPYLAAAKNPDVPLLTPLLAKPSGR